MNVTLTLALPTTRADGTPLAAASIANLSVWRASGSAAAVVVGSVLPSASPLVFVDNNLAAGAYGYQVSATDTQNPPLTSALSDVFPVVIAGALAAPSPPTIVSAAQS
jgi:hypothetical protein